MDNTHPLHIYTCRVLVPGIADSSIYLMLVLLFAHDIVEALLWYAVAPVAGSSAAFSLAVVAAIAAFALAVVAAVAACIHGCWQLTGNKRQYHPLPHNPRSLFALYTTTARPHSPPTCRTWSPSFGEREPSPEPSSATTFPPRSVGKKAAGGVLVAAVGAVVVVVVVVEARTGCLHEGGAGATFSRRRRQRKP